MVMMMMTNGCLTSTSPVFNAQSKPSSKAEGTTSMMQLPNASLASTRKKKDDASHGRAT